MPTLDTQALEVHVQAMYERVALEPKGDFHFELGRTLAEKLGYGSEDLDRIPAEAIDSFAGVGCHFDLAALRPGESVLDLGSGSGMDVFIAAGYVGTTGHVVGVDMTAAQLEKAERLRRSGNYGRVELRKGYIDALPAEDESFDCVISNGVVNLAPDKASVFQEVARVLKPGGRLALSDIVTREPLPEGVTCDATLWAACIGGAMERVAYQDAIEAAGLQVQLVKPNPQYVFSGQRADGAASRWGVASLSLVAVK